MHVYTSFTSVFHAYAYKHVNPLLKGTYLVEYTRIEHGHNGFNKCSDMPAVQDRYAFMRFNLVEPS